MTRFLGRAAGLCLAVCMLWPGRTLVAAAVCILTLTCPAGAAGPHAGSQQHGLNEYLYCPSITGKVYQYRIGRDGTLEPLKPPFVAAGRPVDRVFIRPGARFAYVPGRGVILQYRISNDGTLKPVGAAPPPAMIFETFVLSRDRRNAYGLTGDTGRIFQYVIAGDATMAPLRPTYIATGHGQCWGMALSGNGRAAYVASSDGSVSQFRVAADGRLNALTPAAVPAAPGKGSVMALDVSFDATGRYAYVTSVGKARHAPGFLSTFRVGHSGRLTNVSTQEAPPYSLAYCHSGMLVVRGGGEVRQYRIGPGGRLSPMGEPIDVGGALSTFAFTPDGRFAYAAINETLREGHVAEFHFRADGGLERLPESASIPGDSSGGIFVDPSGRFAYTVCAGVRQATIGQFKIGPSGVLTPLNPPSLPQSPYTGSLTFVRLPAPPAKQAPKTKGKAGAKPAARGTAGLKRSAGKGARKRR